MVNIVKPLTFFDNGKSKREFENFQNFLFQNIDFTKRKEPISFFRSDFRGTKIINAVFFKNNFNRTDFVDSVIKETTFNNCYFGTDFFNTYFHEVEFLENIQDICSFIDCVFYTCSFKNERFSEVTIRDCEFINCTFEDCIFEQNTTDRLSFKNCHFTRINFSDMTALNFEFSSCKFSDLTIDPDYLGTYLFKGTFLKDLKILYRGKIEELNTNYIGVLENFIHIYGKSKRNYEAFNIAIIYNHMSNKKKTLSDLFRIILKNTLDDIHPLRQRNNLDKIMNTLEFYNDSDMISTMDYFSILKILEYTDWEKFNFRDQLKYQGKITILKSLIEEKVFKWQCRSIPINMLMYAEISIDEADLNKVLKLLGTFLADCAREYLGKREGDWSYSVIGTRKGSLCVDLVSYGVSLVVLGTCIRSLANKLIHTSLEFSVYSQIKKILKNANSITEIKKIRKIINDGVIEPSTSIISDAKELGGLIKSLKIFVNTFKN